LYGSERKREVKAESIKAFVGGTPKEISPAYPLRITKSAFASLGGLALSVVGQGIFLYSIGT
jgi:hypothetical protein